MQLSPRRKVFACYCSLQGPGENVELKDRQNMPTRDEVEFPEGVNLCQFTTFAVLDVEIDGKPVVLRSEEPIEESPIYVRQGRIIGLDNIADADPKTAMTLLNRIHEQGDKTLKMVECEGGNIEGDALHALTALTGIPCITLVLPYEEGKVVVLNDVSGTPRETSEDRDENPLGSFMGRLERRPRRRHRETADSAS